MKDTLIILYMIGFLILGSSCLSDIEFDVPGSAQNAIAIQAKIVKGTPNKVFVEVQNAVDFTGLSAAIRVREVILTNISSEQSVEIPNNGVNSYQLELTDDNSGISFNYEDEYTIQITTTDGAVLRSSPEILVPVPKAERLSFEIAEKKVVSLSGQPNVIKVLRFLLDTPTRNKFNNLTSMRWSFEHTYKATDCPMNNELPKTCFITENLGATTEINFNPNILGTEQLTQFELFDQDISSAHAEGNYLTVVQHSLSESAYVYFNQINELLARDGSIFDPPAGVIQTNFVNTSEIERPVFGYFYLTELDTLRVYVDPAVVGSPRRFCPPPPTSIRPTIIQICGNCLDVSRSTLTQPSWWIN